MTPEPKSFVAAERVIEPPRENWETPAIVSFDAVTATRTHLLNPLALFSSNS